MNNNFLDFEKMYEMGCLYNVNAIYYTLVDTLLEQTDTLLLNSKNKSPNHQETKYKYICTRSCGKLTEDEVDNQGSYCTCRFCSADAKEIKGA